MQLEFDILYLNTKILTVQYGILSFNSVSATRLLWKFFMDIGSSIGPDTNFTPLFMFIRSKVLSPGMIWNKSLLFRSVLSKLRVFHLSECCSHPPSSHVGLKGISNFVENCFTSVWLCSNLRRERSQSATNKYFLLAI